MVEFLLGDKHVRPKALLVLIAAAIVLGGGVYALHAFQIKRNARGLYDQFLQMKKEGRPDLAVKYLEQYVNLKPSDVDGMAEFGILLADGAKSPAARAAAMATLDRVLRLDSTQRDVRLRAAKLSVSLGRYPDARHHLGILLDAKPNNSEQAELLHWYGLCETRAKNYLEARKKYAYAVRLAPQQVDLALDYAVLLRDFAEDPEGAKEVIERLVKFDPKALPVRLEAARFYAHSKQWDQAEQHLSYALNERPDASPEVFLLAGEVALSQDEVDRARDLLKKGCEHYPKNDTLIRELARVELVGGDRMKALALLEPSLEKLPNDPNELWALANLLIDTGGLDQASQVIARLPGKASGPQAECLKARVLMRQEKWGQASKMLEEALSKMLPSDPLGTHVYFLLAECFQRLDSPDQRLDACRRAVERDRNWTPARHALAEALVANGKFDEALREYHQLGQLTPQWRRELVRLLIARNARVREGLQRWQDVEQLFKDFAPKDREKLETKILEASFLIARQKTGEAGAVDRAAAFDKARALMEKERDRDPKQVGPWVFLVQLAELQQRHAAALLLIEEAKKAAGPRVEFLLAQAQHWAIEGGPQAPKELEQLERLLGDLVPAEADRLRDALAQAHFALGHADDAQRLWQEQARRQPDNLGVRFQLLERYFQTDQKDKLQAVLGEIRRLEAGSGPLTAYGEAARLMLDVRGDKDKRSAGLPDIRAWLAKAGQLRPSWSRVPLLEAETFEMEDRKDRALEKYKAARERGEGRLVVVRRILQLMYQQRQFAEAAALMRQLPDEAVSAAGLDRMAADLLLINVPQQGVEPLQARRKALELAAKSIKADSKDYREYLWLGQVAVLADKPEDAEKAFRKARELNDSIPDTWASLIFFLARKQPLEAEAELAKAQAKLPADKAPLVLAPAYEVLGKLDLAEEQYQAALAVNPGDPVALRSLAGFFTRTGQAAKAEIHLRALINPKTKAPEDAVAWARRALALSLASRGGLQNFKEAQKLLEDNGRGQAEAAPDRLVKAVVLATQPTHRREAIELLENFTAGQSAVPPEIQFFLAQLYEADFNWPRAKAQLSLLLSAQEKNPIYLAHYARGLLRHGEIQEAALTVNSLLAVAPQAWATAELRARVLQAQNQKEQAAALVKAYAQQKNARLDLAGNLLDALGEADDAEKVFRDLVASSKRPEMVFLLAQHLAKQHRMTEALGLCKEAWKSCPPEVAARGTVAIVRLNKGDKEHQALVEGWLRAAISANPKVLLLQIYLAEFFDATGRHDEAIALQRSILQQDPNNVIALNNLAYLLALKKENLPEALERINKAIDIAGLQAPLLDSRAMVYFRQGQTQLAIQDLQQAIVQTQSAAYYFHLAKVHRQSNNPAAFAEDMLKVKTLGLQASQLHLLEQPEFVSLVKEGG